MLTVKKQLTALGMLLLVAAPLVFSAVIFLKQQLLQSEREKRFETELLETVTLKPENIKWIRISKEIEIDGKLFDVQSFRVIGNKVVFSGFFDSKEDKLVKIGKEAEQHKNKSQNQLLAKFLFFPDYKERESFIIETNWQIVFSQFPKYTEPVADINFPVASPPPKFC